MRTMTSHQHDGDHTDHAETLDSMISVYNIREARRLGRMCTGASGRATRGDAACESYGFFPVDRGHRTDYLCGSCWTEEQEVDAQVRRMEESKIAFAEYILEHPEELA
jgi:hypothetical protein